MSVNKFDFGSFSSTPDAEVFTVAKNYTNPTSETQTRKELSFPLSELKNYINTKIFDEDEVNAVINTDLIPDATTSDKGLMSAADKTKLNGIESGVKKDIWFGTCSTDDATLTKVITTIGSKDFELVQGNVLIVFFENKNTQNNVNLKVDGLTAKALYSAQDGATDMAYWSIDSVVMFVYDGTKFKIINRPNANSNAYGLVKVDQSMSSSSTNPVRNNVIKAYVDNAISGLGGSNVWTATYSGGSVGTSTTLTTTEGGFALSPGNKVIVTFTNASGCDIYDTAKLNIDWAGAKSVLTMDGKQFSPGESWQYPGVPDANKIAQNSTVTFTYDGTNFIADRYNPGTRTEFGLTINNNGFGYAVVLPSYIDPLDPTWMVKLTSASGVDIVLPDFGMHIPYVDVKIYTYTETDGAFEYTPFTNFTYKINEPSIMPTDPGDVDLVITFGSVPATNVVICVHGNFTDFDPSYV